MSVIELISNTLCPYTQRAAIQLAEKGLPFERVYIDLSRKPDGFQALSPLGKVPVLRLGETVVFETWVICEFIEELAPQPPLHPADVAQRARHRAWAEYASALIAEVFGFYMAPDAPQLESKRQELRARFVRLEQELPAAALGVAAGPYFAGAGFSLVDAALAPVFRLFDSFDRIADFQVFDGLPRLQAYRQALALRPSVREAVVPDYHRVFIDYLAGRGSHLGRLAASAAAAASSGA